MFSYSKRAIQLALLFLSLTIISEATAQSDPLESLTDDQINTLLDILERANVAEAAEEWAAALELYSLAGSIAPLPEYGFRQAFCLEKLDRWTEALAMYAGIAAGGGDSETADNARQRVTELQQMPVGTTVESSPSGAEVWIDGALFGTTPVTQTLVPGSYSLEVVLDGYEMAEQDFNVLPLEPKTVAVELDATPGIPGGEGPTISWYTYTLAGASIAATVLGIVFAGDMATAEEEYSALVTVGAAEAAETPSAANTHQDRLNLKSDADDAAQLATISFVSAGVFGAAAVVTLILDLTRETDEPETLSWSPTISPNFVGTAVQVRF